MKLTVINTGFFKLDGGAMFGVVPKQMWKKLHTPDENNMCTWAMRCLLIETADRKILIDTGLGNKQDAKFRSHFEPFGEATLLHSLAEAGCTAEDITDVFLTHFHFDHVGGAVYRNEKNELLPTFPKAVYWSNKAHYQWALQPNAREQASFLKENFVPLAENGVLEYLPQEDKIELYKGFHVRFVYGHTEAMMLPEIDLPDGRKLLYCADLIASENHIGLPYVMAYDIRPLNTIEEKERLLRETVEQNNLLFFEHAPHTEAASLTRQANGKIVLNKTGDLNSFLI